MIFGMRATRALLPLSLLLSLAACDDPFGPRNWDATPDTAQIWSASRAELIGRPAGFDFTLNPPQAVLIEAPGAVRNWDVVLLDHEGGLALAPSSYFLGASAARTAISPRGVQPLEAVTVAPRDSVEYTRLPVPLRVGELYVIRSRVQVCVDGFSSGIRYAKITPVEIDVAEGRVRFAHVRNPYCDDRALIPPDED